MMVDCRESKNADIGSTNCGAGGPRRRALAYSSPHCAEAEEEAADLERRALKAFNLRAKDAEQDLQWDGEAISLDKIDDLSTAFAPEAKARLALLPSRVSST